MIRLACSKASEHSVADIAGYVTRSFEGYFVPIVMSEANLLARIRLDSIDLSESRLVMAGESVAGAALIARRGWSSRVAAMGIVPEWRHQGVGKFLMNELLSDARQRGDHEMMLEVIEQNDAAVHLYESTGFQKVRRLVGLSAEEAHGTEMPGLEEIDVRELGRLISAHGLHDLPWQLSAETIAQFTPPYRAYRMDAAYALISDPEAKQVRFFSLLVEPSARGTGMAQQLLRAIMARHPEKSWHVPAIFPEEIIGPFEAAGFRRDELSQWQMSCLLAS